MEGKSMWFISVPFYVIGKPTPVPHASPGGLLLEMPTLLWVLVVLPPDWEIDVGGRKVVSSPSVLCLPPQSTYCCSELPWVASPFSPDFGTAFRETGWGVLAWSYPEPEPSTPSLFVIDFNEILQLAIKGMFAICVRVVISSDNLC